RLGAVSEARRAPRRENLGEERDRRGVDVHIRAPGEALAMAGELILMVEDNEKNRKLVRDVLTFKGYEVIETERGEDGVRLAKERLPKLVLMDIQLPGINGIEALRQIRADEATRTIPVVAVTASVMDRDRR